MKHAAISALVVLAAAGCSSTGGDSVIGVYRACPTVCETLTLNADHTFRLELEGEVQGHLATDGVWSPADRPNVLRLTPNPDRGSHGSYGADLVAPLDGDNAELTVDSAGGPVAGALVHFDCVSGSFTQPTDNHGFVRVAPCTPKHVNITHDGFYPLSFDIGARRLHATMVRSPLVPMKSEEEWRVLRGKATSPDGRTLHSVQR